MLKLKEGQTVLDIGCGIGGSAFYMAKVSTAATVAQVCQSYASQHRMTTTSVSRGFKTNQVVVCGALVFTMQVLGCMFNVIC